jgi:uncharacterized protein (DUF1015 family)
MAEIRPLRALRYDPAAVGSLERVVAPPYDVIDDAQREELAARSPYNIVAVDLPKESAGSGEDAYEHAGRVFERWQRDSTIVREQEPALWAHTQEYTGPDGVRRTRSGFFCAVHIEEYGAGRVRPHERTHPGPKQDRLRLTRATGCNLSPIFSLYSDPQQAAWAALSPFTADEPWGEVRDAEGTVHRLWRVADGDAITAVQSVAAGSELLIADGHHRYETAQAYAAEADAADPGASSAPAAHHYVLMCLVALEDPGLTVFATHRLVGGLDEGRRAALRQTLERDFEVEEVSEDWFGALERGTNGLLELGFIDARERRPLRLRLRGQAIADAALQGRSEAYRRLDTGVLEALLLKGPLGLTEDDISHLDGLAYARTSADALAHLDSGAYDVAFVMRPTPIAQVRDVAVAGENMPPKSTYFFPKLLTGLLFNPLY